MYGVTIPYPFVFDDTAILSEKLHHGIENIPAIIGLKGPPLHRPVRGISYTLDFEITRLVYPNAKQLLPHVYRFNNILYHALTSILVCLCARKILRSNVLGTIAALIFALHPVQVESVTYIWGRRDVLAGLFFFLCFHQSLLYLDDPAPTRFLGVVSSFLAAILSKEIAATLPILLLLTLWVSEGMAPWALWKARRPGSSETRKFERLSRGLALAAVLLLFLAALAAWIVVLSPVSRRQILWGETLGLHVLMVFKVLGMYLRLLAWPHPLSVDYSPESISPPNSLLEGATLLPFVFVTMTLAASAWLGWRKRLHGLGILWVFAALLPVCHIIPHHELMAEHQLYIPMFGFALLVSVLLAPALRAAGGVPRAVGTSSAAFLLVAYAALTALRNRDWSDPALLWGRTLDIYPRNARALVGVGQALYLQGESASARADQERIQGKHEASARWKEKSAGLFQGATEHFARALEIRPDDPLALRNLAYMYRIHGNRDDPERYRKAERLYLRILERGEAAIGSDAPFYAELELAQLYDHVLAEESKALKHYVRFLNQRVGGDRDLKEIDRGNISMQAFLLHAEGRVLLREGRVPEAIRKLEASRERMPGNPHVRSLLGSLYRTRGMIAEAEEELRAAASAHPFLPEHQLDLVKFLLTHTDHLTEASDFLDSYRRQKPGDLSAQVLEEVLERMKHVRMLLDDATPGMERYRKALDEIKFGALLHNGYLFHSMAIEANLALEDWKGLLGSYQRAVELKPAAVPLLSELRKEETLLLCAHKLALRIPSPEWQRVPAAPLRAPDGFSLVLALGRSPNRAEVQFFSEPRAYFPGQACELLAYRLRLPYPAPYASPSGNSQDTGVVLGQTQSTNPNRAEPLLVAAVRAGNRIFSAIGRTEDEELGKLAADMEKLLLGLQDLSR